MRRQLLMCTLAACALLAATPGFATVVSDPLRVRLEGPPVEAVAGLPVQGAFRLEARSAVEIEDMRLEGRGWTVRRFDGVRRLEPGPPQLVTFEAVPSSPDEPLILSYDVRGRVHKKRLDLSPKTVRRASTVGPSLAVAHTGRVPSPEVLAARPRTEAQRALSRHEARQVSERRREAERTSARRSGSPPTIAARNITVTGRIMYDRVDASTTPPTVDRLGADGVRVTIYDEDDGWDEFLDEDFTDEQGNFSITFRWDPGLISDAQPDILVHYETDATHVKVQSANLIEIDYSWESGTVDDYQGSNLDFGTLVPGDEDEHGALSLHTIINRAWRWFHDHESYEVPYVEVQWPEEGYSSSFYRDAFEEIHIIPGREWSEGTAVHEYGHHWVENFAADLDPEYCNGFCDDSADDCGHCAWCQENERIAFSEGFPNYIADVVIRTFTADYGVTPTTTRSQEALGVCSDDGTTHPALVTEGFFGALLRDIEDSSQDDNDATNPWRDRLAMGTDEIFDLIDDTHPLRNTEFIDAFKAAHPEVAEDLWETAKDIGFELDDDPPSGVANIASLTHPPLSETSDATATFTWTRPGDDMSGVSAYSVAVSLNNPSQPFAIANLGQVTSWTSGELAPGIYWFNIRTRDRANRWQTGYATYGPFTIRAPEAANLAADLRVGWGSVVVPRPAADAAAGSCPAPATLAGNAASTYWNTSGENTGELATSASCFTRLYVDGAHVASTSQAIVAGGTTFYSINRGPVSIRGGRHTFESFLDGAETLAEGSETDNHWANQWIWSPLPLAAGVPVTRSMPPDPIGGWEWIGPGPALWYNCDGLRMTTPGFWNAVWVYAANDADDYDCRLHAPSTGPSNGFGVNSGYSGRAAGCLDAVLVNRNQTATASWDVGVIRSGSAASAYTARYVVSQGMAVGDSVVVTLPAGEMLMLRDVDVQPGDEGFTRIKVVANPTDEPLHVAWFDDLFATGDLMDASAETVTDENGVAVLLVDIEFAASHGLAIYRDPKDGAAGVVALTIDIEPAPPDFEPVSLAGWYSPMVPRAAADGLPNLVPPPTSLTGNAPATYLNFAAGNTSPGAAATGMRTRAYLDGVYSWAVLWSDFDPGESRGFNSATARTVRGGRHTLSLHHDGDEVFEEEDESNNLFGEQWVWSPLALAPSTPVSRSAPPQPLGGGTDVRAGWPLWYNCDGLRTPVFAPAGPNGFWGAVAVMPGVASDVDVRLHEVANDAKSGFAANLKRSSWGPGLSDFVLVHFRPTPFRAFDAGVLLSTGGEAYTAEVVSSVLRGVNPSGTMPACTLAVNRILQLHEFYLNAGEWDIELEHLAGAVSWGLSVYPGDVPYMGKADVLEGGGSWGNESGPGEHLVVTIPADGFYCVAAWKQRAQELGAIGAYRLRIAPRVVDAGPAALPGSIAFGTAGPNPFGRQTALAFELPTARDVRLEVFDVRGARVSTLASGRREAGRHVVRWSGADDDGRALPGGIYLARFETAGFTRTRKLVKVD